jgi:predicted permease
MATLFLLMSCGFLCRKWGIIDNASSKALSRLIVSVGQPMMIISALANAEYNAANLTIAWQTTLISFAIHTLISVIAFLICRRNNRVDWMKIFEFSLVFANCGFIGFPILDSILGDGRGSFMGAFYVIAFHLFLWTWGIIILARKRDDIKITPKKVILNFGTVPSAIGIALFLMKGIDGFVIPQPIMLSMSFVASLCTPIPMLIIGALIASRSLKPMLCSGKIYYLCAMKLIVLPVVVCGLMRLTGFSADWILFAAVVASMPSATTVTMLAELHDISPVYSAQAVGATTLFSVATMPCVVWIAQWLISL